MEWKGASVPGYPSGRLSVEAGFIIPKREAVQVLRGGRQGRILVGVVRHLLHRQDNQHCPQPIAQNDVQVV